MKLFRALPKTMPSRLGPITVRLSSDLVNGEAACGKYSFDQREIVIQTGMHPDATRQTLWHEWIHSVIFDAGLNNLITKDQHEAVCDVIATALATHF